MGSVNKRVQFLLLVNFQNTHQRDYNLTLKIKYLKYLIILIVNKIINYKI
jgi:hypothetical protein